MWFLSRTIPTEPHDRTVHIRKRAHTHTVSNKREPSIKLLYVTPERLLKSMSFQDLLTFLQEHVSL